MSPWLGQLFHRKLFRRGVRGGVTRLLVVVGEVVLVEEHFKLFGEETEGSDFKRVVETELSVKKEE